MKAFLICGKAKDIGNVITDHFKNNLNKCINANGLKADITIRLSQELDMLVVKEQLKKVNNYDCQV